MSISRVALFPGQGSQQVGMAKDLYANFKVVREIFEEASDAIQLNLRKLCFEGPEAELTATENTQPCLLTTSVAAFRVAQKELGFRPDAVAGHSLGEYSALVAANVFPLATAVSWVRERGRAMQQAVPAGQGTMAAIMGLDDAAIERLCQLATQNAKTKRSSGENPDLTVEVIVEPANYNSPGQTVIAGSLDAVNEAIALVKTGDSFDGGKAIPLSVSAPFHCRLMRPARERMEEIFGNSLAAARPKSPSFPYIPNRTGRLNTEAGIVFEMLVEQIDHSVLWNQSMKTLLEAGATTAIEFGPGKVLSGLMKRIAQPLDKKCILLNVGDSSGIKGLEALK
ncbi:ACP S-malonyltransferase [Bdellovibrionota bacterium FG-1]